MTDPISDMLTRVRNAIAARHTKVDIPASRLKTEIARIMKEEGYITNYSIKTSENSSILLMLGGYAFLEYAHWPIEHLVFAVAGLIFTGVGHALWRYRQLSLSTAA